MLSSSPLLAIFDVGGPELMLIMLVILLLFGGQKLPELARGLGKSVREFKKATAGVEEEIKKAIALPPESTQPKSVQQPPTATTAPSATPANPFPVPQTPPDKPAVS